MIYSYLTDKVDGDFNSNWKWSESNLLGFVILIEFFKGPKHRSPLLKSTLKHENKYDN